MKFYSETLKKLFDSEDALIEAENRASQLEQEEQERKNKVSAEKKIAATKVQIATEAYETAADAFEKKKKEILKNLDDAEAEAAKIINAANDKADEELKTATEELNKARSAKLEAISEFNNSYGPYKTAITKESAEKEYNRIAEDINYWLDNLYRFF